MMLLVTEWELGNQLWRHIDGFILFSYFKGKRVQVFGSYDSMFKIWVFYFEFGDALNSHVLVALNWGCG